MKHVTGYIANKINFLTFVLCIGILSFQINEILTYTKNFLICNELLLLHYVYRFYHRYQLIIIIKNVIPVLILIKAHIMVLLLSQKKKYTFYLTCYLKAIQTAIFITHIH